MPIPSKQLYCSRELRSWEGGILASSQNYGLVGFFIVAGLGYYGYITIREAVDDEFYSYQVINKSSQEIQYVTAEKIENPAANLLEGHFTLKPKAESSTVHARLPTVHVAGNDELVIRFSNNYFESKKLKYDDDSLIPPPVKKDFCVIDTVIDRVRDDIVCDLPGAQRKLFVGGEKSGYIYVFDKEDNSLYKKDLVSSSTLNKDSNTHIEPALTQCDIEATHSNDNQGLAPPVEFNDINSDSAVSACLAAIEEYPDSGRISSYLSRSYNKAGDYKNSLLWAKRAASLGYPFGHYMLAIHFKFGDGVEKNEQMEFKHRLDGALNGLPIAYSNVGNAYRLGMGVSKNNDEAKKWLQKGIDAGVSSSFYYMGLLHEEGIDGSPDIEKAIELHREANRLGYKDSKKRLKKLERISLLDNTKNESKNIRNNQPYENANESTETLESVHLFFDTMLKGSGFRHFLDFQSCELTILTSNNESISTTLLGFDNEKSRLIKSDTFEIHYKNNSSFKVPFNARAIEISSEFSGNLVALIESSFRYANEFCPNHLNEKDSYLLQQYLIHFNYELNKVDGKIGKNTLNRISQYIQTEGLNEDSVVRKDLLRHMKRKANKDPYVYYGFVGINDESNYRSFWNFGLKKDHLPNERSDLIQSKKNEIQEYCDKRRKSEYCVIGYTSNSVGQKKWMAAVECKFKEKGKKFTGHSIEYAMTRKGIDDAIASSMERYPDASEGNCKGVTIIAADGSHKED